MNLGPTELIIVLLIVMVLFGAARLPKLARSLAGAIPGARLIELRGAGHMLPYEEPDQLAEIILSAGPGGMGGAPPTRAAEAAEERSEGGAS